MVVHHRALRLRVYRGSTAQLFGKNSRNSAEPKLVGQNAFASMEHRIGGRSVTIGSAEDNDLVLPHRTVSAHHASIRQTAGSCYIRDLGSTNGTFLNGQRIEVEQPLRPGDEVRFGAARFAMVASPRKPPSRFPIYLGAAAGLLALAGAGYLGVDFVRNWENLESLPTASPNASASARTGEIASASSPKIGPTPTGEASASPQPSPVSELEAALRRAYSGTSKGDAEGREAYERALKQGKAVVAEANATLANAKALAVAKFREITRRGESAFPEGPGNVAPAGPTQWLAELNRDRAAVESPPVTEDPALSDGDLKHAKYVVTNYPTRAEIGVEMHSEDPAKPGYTAEGLAAAGRSNVAPYWYGASPPPSSPTSPLLFFNEWLVAPFHRPSILDPDLHRVGYGQFCQEGACAAALNASGSMQPVTGPIPYLQPILFPPQKYPVALIDVQSEWPSPASPCPGYTFPIGLPITLQLGKNFDAKLSSFALTSNSKPVEACGYDATTYVNPSAVDQERGRSILHWFGEVVIVPRLPLERGATYEVSATVNDKPYKWSFTVSR